MDTSALSPFTGLLLETSLFQGFSQSELEHILGCLTPSIRGFAKGEIIQMAGYPTRQIGILLAGQLQAMKTTPDGTKVSIATLQKGGIFGDVLSASGTKSPVTVLAVQPCRILFLSADKIMRPCPSGHGCHLKLLQNWVCTISEKYFSLNRRLDFLILKGMRTKLCTYLLEQSQQAGADTFTISLSRAALAEYLNCERSALCRELSRMRQEGLIETYKNSFKLLNKPQMEQHCQR